MKINIVVNLIIIVLVTLSCKSKATFAKNTPTIDTYKNYHAIAETTGDLDQDTIDEKLVAYDTNRETFLGIERELHIYKKFHNQWMLQNKIIGAILPSEGGGMWGDPFESIQTKNGTIIIDHFGGSREKWRYTHTFKQLHGVWKLINAHILYFTNCDFFEELNYNLLTGNVGYTKELEDCSEENKQQPITITEQEEFILKPDTLPNMNGFNPGETEIKLPHLEKVFYY